MGYWTDDWLDGMDRLAWVPAGSRQLGDLRVGLIAQHDVISLVVAQTGVTRVPVLGIHDFARIAAAASSANALGRPLLLMMDAAGVKADDAPASMLGFRGALHAIHAFRAAGGRGATLVGGKVGCFGAAAECALSLGPVFMDRDSRLAIAGTRSYEFMGIAVDQNDMMLGNRQRTGEAVGPIPNDLVAVFQGWTEAKVDAPCAAETSADARHILPDGTVVDFRNGIVDTLTSIDGVEVQVLGLIPGQTLDLDRSRLLQQSAERMSGLPLVLLTDIEQSFSASDNRNGLAKAYADLAQAIARRRAGGDRTIAYSGHGGTGAAFIMFGMMADHFVAAPEARFRSVPDQVAHKLFGDKAAGSAASAADLAALRAIEVLEADQLAGDRWSRRISALAQADAAPFGDEMWLDAVASQQSEIQALAGQFGLANAKIESGA